MPDFLAAMERRLYTQKRRTCYAQFAAAYEQMSKAFDALQAALLTAH
ncbi:MAG: hypothetical protein LIO42_03495 [Oscillospiraceae bacterium]|nr:hypothetical protein [Oscillospiraceae bacterium]